MPQYRSKWPNGYRQLSQKQELRAHPWLLWSSQSNSTSSVRHICFLFVKGWCLGLGENAIAVISRSCHKQLSPQTSDSDQSILSIITFIISTISITRVTTVILILIILFLNLINIIISNNPVPPYWIIWSGVAGSLLLTLFYWQNPCKYLSHLAFCCAHQPSIRKQGK